MVRKPSKSSKNRSTPQKATKKPDPRWVLAALILLGLVLRVVHLNELRQSPDFSEPYIDAAYHDVWARGIAFGDWRVPDGLTDPEIRATPYFRPPGYPYLLAGVYKISGGSYLAPRVFQLLFGLLNVALAWFLARRLFGDTAAHVTGFLMATYWGFIYFEGELLAPVFLISLVLGLLHLILKWGEGFALRWSFLAGLVFGLFALFRANILLFGPIVLFWVGWMAHRRGILRAYWPSAQMFVIASVLTILPVSFRNLMVARDSVLITSNAGINLYIGNNPQADGVSAVLPNLEQLTGLEGWTSFDYPLIVRGVERQHEREMRHSEVSSYFTGLALDFIRHNPGQFIGLCLKKAGLFWGPREVSNNKVLALERSESPLLSILPGFSIAFGLALFGLVLLIMAYKFPASGAADPPKWERWAPALLLLLVYFASFVPFFVTGRFRLPIVPILFLFAGYGLQQGLAALKTAPTQAVRAGLALVACMVFAQINWVHYEPNQALWHYHRGVSLESRGAYDRAEKEYRKALSLNEGMYEAHNKLGIVRYRAGDISDALTHWRRSIDFQPDQVQIINNVAWIMATHRDDALREPEQAIGYAQKACGLTNYLAPHPLGTLAAAYAAAGRFEDAIKAGEKALALAEDEKLTDLVVKLQQQIDFYRAGRPFIESVP